MDNISESLSTALNNRCQPDEISALAFNVLSERIKQLKVEIAHCVIDTKAAIVVENQSMADSLTLKLPQLQKAFDFYYDQWESLGGTL